MDTAIIHTTIFTAMAGRDTTRSEPLTTPSRMMAKMIKNSKDTTHERTRLRMNCSSMTCTDSATNAIRMKSCLTEAWAGADMATPMHDLAAIVLMAIALMMAQRAALAALAEEATEVTPQ